MIMQDTSSKQDQTPPKAKRGGWTAMGYILGNESVDKIASMSLIVNMTVYLQTQYNLGGVFIVNVITIWGGISNITSLFGSIIADAYLGRFRTLLFGSFFSLLGMVGMTLTVYLPSLTPPNCKEVSSISCPQPQNWQLAFLFASLGFLSIGAGGIRPCNTPFVADQFDMSIPNERAKFKIFFDWWYFFFTAALLVALLGVVYVQTNVSWTIGFVIPAVCFVLSIFFFLIGVHTYIRKKPEGSVVLDMIKVIVASFKKRRLIIMPPDSYPPFYDPPTEKSKLHLKLDRTDRFKFIEKAAIISDTDELDVQGNAKNAWRLCSLQQVEEMKCFLASAPVWISGSACFVVIEQQNAFGVLQAIQMNRNIYGSSDNFQIPPGWMSLTPMLAFSIWLFYEMSYLRLSKTFTGRDPRLSLRQRIRIGIFMSILCMVVAAIVEKQRRGAALKHGLFVSPKSILWLLPQFVLSGLVEAFSAVAVMQFYATQMPERLRTFAVTVFFISLSIVSYVSALLINIVHVVTKRQGRTPWLGGRDLNRNRLDYYYLIVAGLAVLNLFYFTFFAGRFGKEQIQSSNTAMEDEKHDKERGKCFTEEFKV